MISYIISKIRKLDLKCKDCKYLYSCKGDYFGYCQHEYKFYQKKDKTDKICIFFKKGK